MITATQAQSIDELQEAFFAEYSQPTPEQQAEFDWIDERRRLCEYHVLNAVSQCTTVAIHRGRLVVFGSNKERFTKQLEPFNEILPGFFESLAVVIYRRLLEGKQ